MEIHFYMLCYRFEALVASHLSPESFGRYMATGTQKNTKGNVIFFEISRNLKSKYFKIDDIEQRCQPHPDGSPKRSKYISIYRVLENLELDEFGKLYLCTADGRVLGLEEADYDYMDDSTQRYLYEELCPVSPMVVSALAPPAFLKFMTNPANPVHVPKLFFADMLLEVEPSGHLAGYLPYRDPMHIIDCLKEVGLDKDKPTKTVTRTSSHPGFFRTIRRGFFLGDQKGMKFYKFPERRVLEVEHYHWWRSASESLT